MNKVESSTVDCIMFIYILRCYHGGKVDTLMKTVRLHLEKIVLYYSVLSIHIYISCTYV